uniref:Uncharacterized protein n=1 Tax=Janibacter limosus TaxID=53458 RepID=A0AC61U8P8_9MICO|nr:hypothetical protein [Janibacter limosus]
MSNGTGRDGAARKGAPKVGWCWAGNRHTGSASPRQPRAQPTLAEVRRPSTAEASKPPWLRGFSLALVSPQPALAQLAAPAVSPDEPRCSRSRRAATGRCRARCPRSAR